MLSIQGEWVQSLVGELRSHMSCGKIIIIIHFKRETPSLPLPSTFPPKARAVWPCQREETHLADMTSGALLAPQAGVSRALWSGSRHRAACGPTGKHCRPVPTGLLGTSVLTAMMDIKEGCPGRNHDLPPKEVIHKSTLPLSLVFLCYTTVTSLGGSGVHLHGASQVVATGTDSSAHCLKAVSKPGCPLCSRYLFLLVGGGALAVAAMGAFAALVFIPALCTVVLIHSLGPRDVHRPTFLFQMTWQTMCHLGLHYTEYYLQEAPSTR